MVELAEIFQEYGAEYLSKFQDKMLPSHLKAMKAICECRTPQLGGQVYACAKCETQDYSYHSCNNRNCPKCGGDKIQQWTQKQFDLLLPVPYFFVTFTLPEELRLIVRSNQKYFYTLFFKVSAQALKILAREKRFIGGDIGFLGIIQSWARNLIYHPHIHYIVPGAALSDDRKKYIKIKNNKFLVHVKPLSMLFKRLFKEGLQKTEFFNQIPSCIWKKDWVVHAEAAGYGQEIIKYIAPYVYRVALSNNRIKNIADRKVTFEYEDSETKKTQICTLDVLEFMRRFLQHVLPQGFVKVRYFGIMGAKEKDKWFLLKNIIFQALAKKNKTLFLDIEYFQQKKKPNHCCRSCGGELILISILQRGP
jgi:hypothetical protein